MFVFLCLTLWWKILWFRSLCVICYTYIYIFFWLFFLYFTPFCLFINAVCDKVSSITSGCNLCFRIALLVLYLLLELSVNILQSLVCDDTAAQIFVLFWSFVFFIVKHFENKLMLLLLFCVLQDVKGTTLRASEREFIFKCFSVHIFLNMFAPQNYLPCVFFFKLSDVKVPCSFHHGTSPLWIDPSGSVSAERGLITVGRCVATLSCSLLSCGAFTALFSSLIFCDM